MFFSTAVTAQISDSLYKALPDSLRPKSKAAITQEEKIKIAYNIDFYTITHFSKETYPLIAAMSREMAASPNQRTRVLFAQAIAAFYIDGNIVDSALVYYYRVIDYIGSSTVYNSQLAEAYLYLGNIYASIFKQDSAISFLHKGLDVKGVEKDSTFMGYAYNVYQIIYGNLKLDKEYLYYSKKYLALIPATEKWGDNYTYTMLEIADAYGRLYHASGREEYKDSAEQQIYTVMEVKRNSPGPNYPYCYFLLGELEFWGNHYKTAIALFDSSLHPINKNQDLDDNKRVSNVSKADRAVCLVKLGDIEGIHILDTLTLEPKDFQSLMVRNQILYEYARTHGNWQAALQYHEKYMQYADSMAVIAQTGQVFEAEQKYSVKEKEADIAVLQNKNLQAQATRNKIIAIAIIVVLLLGMALYIRNTQQRHQRALALASQRQAISANMHDEVGSSLATLRYLITDLKAKAGIAETKAVLEDLEEEAKHVYIQSRNFVHHINNEDVQENYNVTALLQKLALRYNSEGENTLQVNIDADEDAIEKYFTPLQHAEIYRVIQEAVANSMKHSGATEINITLQKKANVFYFEIKDNGVGANIPAVQTGMGLRTIKKRLTLLKGKVSVTSSSIGTVVSGTFPAAR